MRKQFVLMVVAMVVFAVDCCGCGLQGCNTETDANGVEATVTEGVSEPDVPGIPIVVEDEADAAETASVEIYTQEDVAKKVEEAELVTTEATAEPTVEAQTESSGEPTETSTEQSTEQTPEALPENSFIAYDPNRVVALATEKTKAYGKILVWENLDRLLAEGQITQEEYNEYYPYDGLEDSYYSVFIETDLSKVSTISGELLGTEDGIAEYIAEMLALETGPYFAISYAGIYEGISGDFYEFRCHR